MADVLGFLTLSVIILLTVAKSNCQCASEMCEKTSLSLKTNTKHNYSLSGYVIETLSLDNWKICFNVCLKNCQCLSFNFNEVNTTENCELNDANIKLEPEALEQKEGVIYYELARNYYDKNGVPQQTCSDPDCQSNCCDSVPCQNGGTCRDLCDVNKRRFNCTCSRVFTGHRCQFPAPRSCKDIMMINTESINGIYNILDQHNNSFPVYCDFDSEPDFAWTLIQSHSLQNNDAFKDKAFYLHDMPINQDAPERNSYRLSKSRMKSIQDVSTHWRATCNFLADGIDFHDYIRTSFAHTDFLAVPDANRCILYEFVDIRGNKCENCTVLSPYSTVFAYHIDSWWDEGCDFMARSGGIEDEDNFGRYFTYNTEFRCSSSMTSTSQFWIGGP